MYLYKTVSQDVHRGSMTYYEIKLCCLHARFRVKYGGQHKVVMVIVLETYPLDLLVFKQQTSYGCRDRPTCLSLQNRRAEWKQLHSGPSGIHAEMKLSNASGPRTDFLMCESYAVFTDVFCLRFSTC